MSVLDQMVAALSGNPDAAPGAPEDPTEALDDAKIIAKCDQKFAEYKHGRPGFERAWYRNMLFLHGNQWITWDATEGKFRKRKLASWVPTPVTNRFASTYERLVSVLSRVEPNWMFVPSTDRLEDITSADMANGLEPIIAQENKLPRIREQVAKWMVGTGNAFVLSMPETGDAGTKMYSEVYSPFETYGDMTVPSMDDQECVILSSRRDDTWTKTRFGIDEVPLTDSKELGLIYHDALAYITPDEYDILRSTSPMGKKVLIRRLIHRPCEDFPQGLFATIIGDKVVDKTVLPKDVKGDIIWPLIHFKFDEVPAAFFARTPMYDVAKKQEQRNRLESLIELITIRMSSPVWFLPEGTAIKNFVGEPGAVLKYSQMGDKAGKPERLSGENVPNSLFGFLQQIDKDIEEVASTFEALKGQTPYSGAPGVVIEQLIEQGLTRFGPALRGIAESWRQWMLVQIELFRQYANEPRQMAQLSDTSKWKFDKFSGSDFTGSVDVRVESDSTIPRSEHVEIAKVMASLQAPGLIDMQDPTVRQKVLHKLKLHELQENIDEDILAAAKENEAMAAMDVETWMAEMEQYDILEEQAEAAMVEPPEKPPLPIQHRPGFDNDAVHMQSHKSFMLSDAGQAVFEPMMQHYMEHVAYVNGGVSPEDEAESGGAPGAGFTQKDMESIDPAGNASAPIPPQTGVV